MERIVYFVGSHGTGKSTLIRSLCTPYSAQYKKSDKLRLPKNLDSIEERQFARACRFYFQLFTQKDDCDRFPEAHILCDRAYYDGLVYSEGFAKLGWIDPVYHERLKNLHRVLFPPANQPRKVVYLNPPLDFIKEGLAKRWAVGRKKWREDNFDYLQATVESYQEFMAQVEADVLEITETDLEKRVEMVRDWLPPLTDRRYDF